MTNYPEYIPPDKYALAYLSEVVYAVEADTFAAHQIWCEWSHEGKNFNGGKLRYEFPRCDIKQDRSGGYGITIGFVDKRPIVVSIYRYLVNNKPVVYYWGCSQLVDHVLIDRWIAEALPDIPKTDASNFTHCVHHINKLIENSV